MFRDYGKSDGLSVRCRTQWRADVAAFLVSLVGDTDHVRATGALSG